MPRKGSTYIVTSDGLPKAAFNSEEQLMLWAVEAVKSAEFRGSSVWLIPTNTSDHSRRPVGLVDNYAHKKEKMGTQVKKSKQKKLPFIMDSDPGDEA